MLAMLLGLFTTWDNQSEGPQFATYCCNFALKTLAQSLLCIMSDLELYSPRYLCAENQLPEKQLGA
jgi:hypothetical protein